MSAGPTDRELVGSILATGDEAAFRALYRRHTPALYRTAVRLTEDRGGVAEDLVHDTWLRAAERLAGFEWRSALATWLTGILFNRVREIRREWTRRDAVSLDLAPEPPALPRSEEDRIDLERAIAELPPGYRAAVLLYDVEGFSHEEVAEILGIDVGTSKSQLSRARRRLRWWLGPEERPA
ncbi:MAG: RNA polymerase sigma factor [Gemmatimonadales bacterium]